MYKRAVSSVIHQDYYDIPFINKRLWVLSIFKKNFLMRETHFILFSIVYLKKKKAATGFLISHMPSTYKWWNMFYIYSSLLIK